MKNMPFKPLLIKFSLPLVMIGGIFASYQVARPTLSRVKKYYSAKQEIQKKLSEDGINLERVIVRYKEGVTEEEIGKKAVKHTGKKQKLYKPKHKAPLVQTVHKKKNQPLEDLMLAYMMDDDVESVDVVHKGEIFWTDSGDKTYSDDFDQDPTPATGDHWYFDKINLPELWDDQSCAAAGPNCGGDSSVTVAVLDTGLAFEDYTGTYEWYGSNYNNIVYADASEINGINLYTNASDPYDGGDGDGNGVCDDYHGFDAEIWVENDDSGDPWNCSGSNDTKKEGHPNDDYGHGTYVTGIIASLTNNAAGSVSVAHEVTIMPIKVNLPFTGSVWEDTLYYAVQYAVDNGADVINGSLGWCSDSSGYLKAAVNYAEAAGVTMVFASGNSTCGWSTPLCYPANYNDSNMIAVGAINADNSRSSYSQYGSSLDIVAPVGDSGVSGDGTYHQLLNCAWGCSSSSDFTQFKYNFGTGTSYATPQVAAGAAIIKTENPNATKNEIFELIKHTATDLSPTGKDMQTAFGLLNLEEINSNIWSDWNQKGVISGDVMMQTYNPGAGNRLYQAVRGQDNRLYTRYSTDGNAWSNWEVKGYIKGNASMAVFNGDLYQAVRGIDNKLYTRSTDGTSWTNWNQDGSTRSNVEMTTFNPGGGDRLYQAVRGADKAVYTRYSTDGTSWTAWTKKGVVKKSISMIVFDGKLYQSVRGLDNKVYTRSTDGSTWTNWNVSGQTAGTHISLSTFNPGVNRLYQTMRGLYNGVYTRYTTDGTSWSSWAKKGDTIGNPTAFSFLSISGNKLFQSIKTSDNYVATRWTQDGNNWSWWYTLGKTSGEEISSLTFDPGSGLRLYQALKSRDDAVWTRYLQ